MYRLTVDTSTDQHHEHTATTGADTLEILHGHLNRHLVDGPVSWTITSPWEQEHQGRINLNGNPDDAGPFIDDTLYGAHGVQASLAHELYQQHQLSGASDSMTPTSTPGGEHP